MTAYILIVAVPLIAIAAAVIGLVWFIARSLAEGPSTPGEDE